jgi:hypothetical protein
MDHAKIIADLGGFMAVSRALCEPPNIVWRWGVVRCIPARRWPIIIRHAKRVGHRHITADALLAGYVPAQQQLEADLARIREASGKSPRAAA